MRRLRIAMAQINATVGDFDGNTKKILEAVAAARSCRVDILTFPELAICGYPPEDLLFKQQFVEENQRSLEKVVAGSSGLTMIVGFVDANDAIYNAAAVIHDSKLVDVYHKIYLPNYGIFDEKRYFRTGSECPVYTIAGINIGVNICEDIWYETGPTAIQARSGAEIIININASPYQYGKGNLREKMLAARAIENAVIIAYTNMVGGQDELVFDGSSMILNEKGQLVAKGKQFQEDLIITDLDVEAVSRLRLQNAEREEETPLLQEQGWRETKLVLSEAPPTDPKPPLPPRQLQVNGFPGEVYDALVLGTRDYILKNGFEKVVIGLSGGIDSSLVAVIAADAIGSDNVVGVAMPSPYSSPGSISDAELLARNIGMRLMTIPISTVFQAYSEMLESAFAGAKPDVTEENLQARIRGNILMALSNKFGWLVLTTGNKSETATGYATLYGDMAGGFAVIKDVPKTMVYDLARYRNSLNKTESIPATVIEKPPSAELRPEQKDIDSLPPYKVLDPILTAYVEEDKSVEQIIAMGIDGEVVRRAARLVDTSEYKRRQAPPGIKITSRAFGRDRRLPITNRFKG
ncbi:NAD+ synthase [Chloroflexota bacterium]